MFVFAQTTYGGSFYLKSYFSTYSDFSIYKKYSITGKKESKENKASNVTNGYGIGLGYYFSDYIEAEIIFDQMRCSVYSSHLNIEEIDIESSLDVNTNNRLFAAVYPMYRSDGTFEKFESDVTKIFVIRPQSSNKYPIKLGKSNVNTIYNNISQSERKVLNGLDMVFMNTKIQTVIASFKFKAPTHGSLVPFIIWGVGASKIEIDGKEDYYNNQENKTTHNSALLNNTSFAYRIGVGTKIHLSEKVSIELGARYFDYGEHQLSYDDYKKIEGCDFAAGIIVEF